MPIAIKSAVKPAFKLACCLSTIPTEAGEYRGEYSTMRLSFWFMAFQSLAVNVLPLSLVILAGKPKFRIQPCMKAVQQFWAVASTKGSTSNYLVVRSTIVSRYRYPWEGGKGPTISTWISLKRPRVTGRGFIGGLMILWLFAEMQGWQLVTNLEMSAFIACQ